MTLPPPVAVLLLLLLLQARKTSPVCWWMLHAAIAPLVAQAVEWLATAAEVPLVGWVETAAYRMFLHQI